MLCSSLLGLFLPHPLLQLSSLHFSKLGCCHYICRDLCSLQALQLTSYTHGHERDSKTDQAHMGSSARDIKSSQ